VVVATAPDDHIVSSAPADAIVAPGTDDGRFTAEAGAIA